MPRNNQKSVKPYVLPPSNKLPLVNPLSSVGTTSPSLGQVVKEGMAFGTGSAIAHNIIGRLFGGTSPVTPAKVTQYEHCMELTQNNQEVCEHLR